MGALYQAVQQFGKRRRRFSVEKSFGKWVDFCASCNRWMTWFPDQPKPSRCRQCEGVKK